MTNETKHTPGPWSNEEGTWGDINSSEGDICIVLYEGNVGEKFIIQDSVRASKATAKANARLIAAAPELLEALRDMQVAMRRVGDIIRLHGTQEDRSVVTAALTSAREAIAKATQP